MRNPNTPSIANNPDQSAPRQPGLVGRMRTAIGRLVGPAALVTVVACGGAENNVPDAGPSDSGPKVTMDAGTNPDAGTELRSRSTNHSRGISYGWP
ncbi:hypothetical protein IPJ72_06000 [Candidatus Peregrinibacteria bacterium]|nr:MAG: hypothetical protein IPJ72_06000 [Candidatus Peregrinibacteria bacterium]